MTRRRRFKRAVRKRMLRDGTSYTVASSALRAERSEPDSPVAQAAEAATKGSIAMQDLRMKIEPVLHVEDVERAVEWWARLGFRKAWEHRFGPGYPCYAAIRRDGIELHLSEHSGDARPDTLLFVDVDDLDPVVTEFAVEPHEGPWGGRAVELTDPDGNRLRIGEPKADQPRPDTYTDYEDAD